MQNELNLEVEIESLLRVTKDFVKN